MGVPGLWELLNKAGSSTSIAHLAVVNGFAQNTSRRRGYRVGIDASIWFHHAKFSKGGENPGVRNLFFRLCFLRKLPIIPVFMFDGPRRPKVKRGSKLGKSGTHGLSSAFKKFLDAFGMEWHEAVAEAEAQLAYLNQEGYIDAILTDDCDAFLFGARTIVKNLSGNLSGNKNNQALNEDDKADKLHAMVYHMSDMKKHPHIGLSRGGMILFALLAGGDYHKGVERFGSVTAHALARCSFGDELLEATQNLQGPDLQEFLVHWRLRVNDELGNNTRGFLKHRTTLSVPHDFPDPEVLANYTRPLVRADGSSTMLRDNGQLDISKIGRLCEEFFEWGFRQRIMERFKTLIWPCVVMHILRRAALEADQRRLGPAGREGGKDVGTPSRMVQGYLVNKDKPTRSDREERIAAAFVRRDQSPDSSAAVLRQPPTPDPHPLIADNILRERRHPSTDNILEYYIEVSPIQLNRMVNAGLKGTRAPLPIAERSKVVDLEATFRMWVPAAMLDVAHPSMVQRFKDRAMDMATKSNGRGKKRSREAVQELDSEDLESGEIQGALSTANIAAAVHTVPNDPTRKKTNFSFTYVDPTFDEHIMEVDELPDTPPVPSLVQTPARAEFSSRLEEIVDQIFDNPQKKRKKNPKPPKPQGEKTAQKATGGRKTASKKIKIPKDGPIDLLALLDSVDLT